MVRKHLMCVLALLPVLLLQSCMNAFKAKETRRQAVAHVSGSALHVGTANGSVEVIGDASLTEVAITAEITCSGNSQQEADERLAATVLNIVRDANRTLTIEPVFPDDHRRSGDGASFVIRLPDAHDVDVRTSNGRITVSHVGGELNAATSNGRITVNDHGGPANLETSNGRIIVDGLRGALFADTSNGRVIAKEIGGSVTIDTSNGSIELVLADGSAGPIDIDTSNGSIDIAVGAGFGGRINFDTSNAGVRIVDDSNRILRSHVDHGDGFIEFETPGGLSVVDTSNGSITIRVNG